MLALDCAINSFVTLMIEYRTSLTAVAFTSDSHDLGAIALDLCDFGKVQ